MLFSFKASWQVSVDTSGSVLGDRTLMDQLKGPMLYGQAKCYHLGLKTLTMEQTPARQPLLWGITVGPLPKQGGNWGKVVLILCFVLVHLSHLDLFYLIFFLFLPPFSLCLSTFLLFSLQTHIREYLSKASWTLFETICQLRKTESWRWIPEAEVTPFIQQFIHGTCQSRLLQMRRRARQIRITKTETCLLKWSFPVCVFV